jgi:hypothetical protein
LSERGSAAKAIQPRAGSGVFAFVDRGRLLQTLSGLGDEDPFAAVVTLSGDL